MIEKEIFCMHFKALCEIAVWRILVNKYVGAVVGGGGQPTCRQSHLSSY